RREARNTRWLFEWVPRHAGVDGVAASQSYWVDGEWRVFLGTRGYPPKRTTDACFYINGERAYRDVGHSDGASSVPYLRLSRRGVYADEGFATGSSPVPLFRIRAWKPRRARLIIRRNNRFEAEPE